MSQEIEIEFKNLLTRKEFDQLKHDLHINNKDFVEQHNDYFDTFDFLLKQRKSALRIREKEGFFVLTLKQPHKEGRLEIHQHLTQQQVKDFYATRFLPVGEVQGRLNELNISSNDLNHLGRLSTNRAELKTASGLIVLDHSQYLDHEDFELEFEVTDYGQGKKNFDQLLRKFHIPIRDTPNKIVRFYNYKIQKESDSLGH